MAKAKIVRTDKWYDPEGLNIPIPSKTYFEGTIEECFEKIEELREKHNPKNGIYVDSLGFAKDPNGIVRANHIEIYYMNAIAKEYYRIEVKED